MMVLSCGDGEGVSSPANAGTGGADAGQDADASLGPDTGPDGAGGQDASEDGAGGQDTAGGYPIDGSPFGFHSYGNYDDFLDLGATWYRGGTYIVWTWSDTDRTGEFHFRDATAPPKPGVPGSGGPINYDRERAGVPEGVNMLANVCPFRPGGVFQNATEKNTYAQFVAKMVERYDGDADLGCDYPAPDCYRVGDGEYPDSETVERLAANPVRHWQVCNEVLEVCDDSTCMQTYAANFAEVQVLSYDAVKQADPEATVLIAGDSAMDLYPDVFAILAGTGVDVIDFHRFGEEQEYDPTEHLGYLRSSLLDSGFDSDRLRFWITETGTWSGDPVNDTGGPDNNPFQDEKQHASGMVKRYVSALGVGIEKVFWAWGIREGFGCNCCLFDYTGLVYDGNQPPNADGCDANDPYDLGAGVKKLGWYSFKLMREKLDGANGVWTLPSPQGTRLFRFARSGKSVWVAWDDGATTGAGTPVSIEDIATSHVRMTAAVPSVDAGLDVVDPTAAFETRDEHVVAGKVSLTASYHPWFVEEL